MYRTLIALFILLAPTSSFALEKLKILLTNDDGYSSPGITAIHKALLAAGHDVYLIAPATQQSGASSSVTSGGYRVEQKSEKVWAVHGRPADSVRFGLGEIMKDALPDLVVSGANFGNNTGADVMISGTVGAALMALQMGVPAIAVSVEIKLTEEEFDNRFPSTIKAFPGAGNLVAAMISNMKSLNNDSILNVNYPALQPAEIKGVKMATLSAHTILGHEFTEAEEGKWESGLNFTHLDEVGTDAALLSAGYITVTKLDRDISSKPGRKDKGLVRELNNQF